MQGTDNIGHLGAHSLWRWYELTQTVLGERLKMRLWCLRPSRIILFDADALAGIVVLTRPGLVTARPVRHWLNVLQIMQVHLFL